MTVATIKASRAIALISLRLLSAVKLTNIGKLAKGFIIAKNAVNESKNAWTKCMVVLLVKRFQCNDCFLIIWVRWGNAKFGDFWLSGTNWLLTHVLALLKLKRQNKNDSWGSFTSWTVFYLEPFVTALLFIDKDGNENVCFQIPWFRQFVNL